jgi:two-component system cell cycle sensor histidine kinase/response regulator CckA
MTDPLPGKRKAILFVDDEEMLVEISRKMLEQEGHEVVGRTSSVAALEDFRRDPEKFGLAIIDLTMPELSGVDLARAILRVRPGLRIILCTGMPESLSPGTARETGIHRVLTKPIMSDELTEAVRMALGNGFVYCDPEISP